MRDVSAQQSKSSVFFILFGLFAIAALIIGGYFLWLRPAPETVAAKSTDQEKVAIKPATATTEINRSFTFPLFGEGEEEAPPVEFLLTTAEKRDEIIVQGKQANSIQGRTFLIVNMKIKNNYTKGIEIQTKNFFRLSYDEGNEWLAPDIHNDPVAVQAISTKPTRIGFPVDETVKSFILQVGEINGEKQQLRLEFDK